MKSMCIPVAEIDAHLRGHAEEPRDEVVRLEDAVLVHQLHEHHERLAAVLAGVAVVVGRHPLPQQELRLLQQPRRVLELPRLMNECVNYDELW